MFSMRLSLVLLSILPALCTACIPTKTPQPGIPATPGPSHPPPCPPLTPINPISDCDTKYGPAKTCFGATINPTSATCPIAGGAVTIKKPDGTFALFDGGLTCVDNAWSGLFGGITVNVEDVSGITSGPIACVI
ncbi:hypothetical protein PRIPAC_95246 [Pristionchus pacificus]|uniref:Uncharacterized protein n=1 Tax=Pristionchus pacificus TaxID=54126 RepID=A0A2A6D335_PRIPA|nr:hypothetical protein PRIPAC_95246 [Pristionchus pacificus]|eukprot:PDM84701.1 hypothetical protein PRIPAC_33724 [Pristionchus pacificus]